LKTLSPVLSIKNFDLPESQKLSLHSFLIEFCQLFSCFFALIFLIPGLKNDANPCFPDSRYQPQRYHFERLFAYALLLRLLGYITTTYNNCQDKNSGLNFLFFG